MKKVWTLTKRLTWEAAHMLGHLPVDHPCSSMHGHTYRCEITLGGDSLDDPTMMLIDLNVLKLVRDRFDHKLLNEVMRGNPTVENLCDEVGKMVNDLVFKAELEKHVHLFSVTIQETENNTCTLTYLPEA